MPDRPDPEIEVSPLSGDVTADGVSVEVAIYRIKDSGEEWSLEVIDASRNSTVWDERFASDEEAHREFKRCLAEEGMHALLSGDRGTLH